VSNDQINAPVRIVLDSSAIVAFTRGSIHVGEVLAELVDEDASAALPAVCLVEAVHSVADFERLDLLVQHRATCVLSADPDDWRALAALYDIVGRLDAASAALAALDCGCKVLTRQAGLYAGLAHGGPVITIDE
jgi:hypothetical protein